MNAFKELWKIQATFEKKEALNKTELKLAREIIDRMQKKKSSSVISALQKAIPKLQERWKAERVYWTETKRDDTEIVGDAAVDLGFETYKVILAPHPCPVCIQKTNNGAKIFKNVEVQKSGYGHVPPFHPNCYCVLIPRA